MFIAGGVMCSETRDDYTKPRIRQLNKEVKELKKVDETNKREEIKRDSILKTSIDVLNISHVPIPTDSIDLFWSSTNIKN